MDVTADGTAHFAFTDEATSTVHHIESTADGWSTPIVISAPNRGEDIDAEMDMYGRFHAIYTSTGESEGESLLHTRRNADGTWTGEVIVTESSLSLEGVNLTTDSSGVASFLYYDQEEGAPVLAQTSVFGVISYSTLGDGSEGPVGLINDLEAGHHDRLHMIWLDEYSSDGIGQTTYTQSGSSDSEWAMIKSLAMSVDVLDDGTPCIATSTWDSQDIWYGCRTAEPWWMSTVEEVLTEGYNLHVALAHLSDGTPYLATFDALTGSLSVSVHRDGAWSTEAVASIDATGFDPQIAVDDMDRVHIGFHSITDGTILHAVGR